MIELSGYQVLRELGRGGMARVYLALHEGLDRHVAIKVMNPKFSADHSLSERFLREARIVAKLNHPNIITIFDVNASAGKHYIAMEYMPGKSLAEKIKTGLGTGKALSILKQISMGLKFAHDKGFIHRDIKPENILFKEDDSPVISDFGLARAQASSTMMTKAGMIIGTPRYMSPEQALGVELKASSDIYSLGVMFYEMLTGLTLYRANTPVAIMYKHVNEPVPELSGEHERLQPLLEKLLAKRAADRYQCAGDIIKDIVAIGDIEASIDTEFNTRVLLKAELDNELTGEVTIANKQPDAVEDEEDTMLPTKLDDELTREVTRIRKPVVSDDGATETLLDEKPDAGLANDATILRTQSLTKHNKKETLLQENSDKDLTQEATVIRKPVVTEDDAADTLLEETSATDADNNITVVKKYSAIEEHFELNQRRENTVSEQDSESVTQADQQDLSQHNSPVEQEADINLSKKITGDEYVDNKIQAISQKTGERKNTFPEKTAFIFGSFIIIAVVGAFIGINSSVTVQKDMEIEKRRQSEKLAEQQRIEEQARDAAMIRQREALERLALEKQREELVRIAEQNEREAQRLAEAEKQRLARERLVAENKRIAIELRNKSILKRKLENQIDLLLAKAESSINRGELISAHEYFREVLALDKTNKRALGGIDNVAKEYLSLAEKAAGQDNFDKADTYVHRAVTIAPSHPHLVATKQILFDLKNRHVMKKAESPKQDKGPAITEKTEYHDEAVKTPRSFGGF